MILRILGISRLPDVATLSRRLSAATAESVEAVRAESRDGVLTRLTEERLGRVTLDFDGSVLSTRRQAEGSAVGYNRKRKGERSYYPLFCTWHRPASFWIFTTVLATFTTQTGRASS